MKISQKRQLDRFKRSLDFIDKHDKDFASGSQALKAREQLKDVVARAESSTSESDTNKTGRRTYHSDKLVALNALRSELSRVSRTAQLVANSDESFDNTFQMPDKRRKNELAKAARHFIEEFPKVSAKFKQFEMDKDDVNKLKSALQSYEEVQATPANKPARQTRIASSSNPVISEGIELVDALDVMMSNKYHGNTDVLDKWKEISTLEVTRRRRKTKNSDE